MSDRLHKSTVLPADEVSPDLLAENLAGIVVQFEDMLDERAERGLPIAVDWNTFRIEAASIVEANDLHGRPGDLRIQASVAVL